MTSPNTIKINAYYTAVMNEIILPLGILQSPFYNEKRAEVSVKKELSAWIRRSKNQWHNKKKLSNNRKGRWQLKIFLKRFWIMEVRWTEKRMQPTGCLNKTLLKICDLLIPKMLPLTLALIKTNFHPLDPLVRKCSFYMRNHSFEWQNNFLLKMGIFWPMGQESRWQFWFWSIPEPQWWHFQG